MAEPEQKPVVAPAPIVDTAKDDIAAIAAAIYALLGAHRIVHIEEAPAGGRAAWTVGGRLAHHTSHAVPHQPKKTH
jgi:hypothetical protein